MASKKSGRPKSNEPRSKNQSLRLTDDECNMLDTLTETYGMRKSVIMRLALHEYYINHYHEDSNKKVNWEYDEEYGAYRACADEEEE